MSCSLVITTKEKPIVDTEKTVITSQSTLPQNVIKSERKTAREEAKSRRATKQKTTKWQQLVLMYH